MQEETLEKLLSIPMNALVGKGRGRKVTTDIRRSYGI